MIIRQRDWQCGAGKEALQEELSFELRFPWIIYWALNGITGVLTGERQEETLTDKKALWPP